MTTSLWYIGKIAFNLKKVDFLEPINGMINTYLRVLLLTMATKNVLHLNPIN